MNTVKITKIQKIDSREKFDIEVEQNHNFFANGILVHNSRSIYSPGKGLYSRKGKKSKVLDHIFSALEDLRLDNVFLDGEIYTHNVDFQKIISASKRDKASEDTASIQYHIYDCFFPKESGMTYLDRFKYLSSLNLTGSLVLVDSQLVTSNDEVFYYHDKFVGDGYEGAMVRNLTGPYSVDKRSYDLLKYKKFDEDEFKIVGAEQNRGTQSDQCTLICETKAGHRFGVKPKGDESEREWYWENHQNLIGQMMTVRYFGFTTSNESVPRFPIGICLRDYE